MLFFSASGSFFPTELLEVLRLLGNLLKCCERMSFMSHSTARLSFREFFHFFVSIVLFSLSVPPKHGEREHLT